MDRKLALMNKQQSQWHRTAGMRPLSVMVKIDADQWVRVEQTSDPILGAQVRHEFQGAGVFELPEAQWSRITLLNSETQSVLCFFQTGGLSAVSSS